MGSYTFRWEKPADEVIITGLFDDWAKTIKMDKKDGIFEKTVHIPQQHLAKKVYYKFVVDGNWIARDDARGEYYGTNYDNFLLPEDIDKDSSAATISSVAPNASTVQMAGQVPQESRLQEEKDVPGAFPETPGATPAAENQTFGISPIPASEGAGNPIALAAGEPVPDASTHTANTITSKVADDPDLKKEGDASTFSVAPIPASEGAGNPIKLAPGEKVPDSSTFTTNTISSSVADDPELKKDDAQAFSVAPIPASSGLGNPIHLAPGEKVPDSTTLTSHTLSSTISDDTKPDSLPKEPESKTNGAALFGIPPVTSSLIPESSLPMGGGDVSKDIDAGPFMQSAGPGTTTAALAGQVPKEPRPDAIISSVAPTSTTAALAGQVPKVSDEVPEVVQESQKEAKVDPEASASAQAVADKTALEAELKKEVPEEPPAAESGVGEKSGNTAAAASAVGADYEPVYPPTSESASAPVPASAAIIPDPVKESIAIADASPEAATNPQAVTEKSAVEEEFKKAVPVDNAAGEPAPTVTAATSATAPGEGAGILGAAATSTATAPTTASKDGASSSKTDGPGLNATKDSPAKTQAAAVAPAVQVPTKPVDSRDSSEPKVTTGVSTATTAKKSEGAPSTPKKSGETSDAPDSAASRKKKHRISGFFQKIKEKF